MTQSKSRTYRSLQNSFTGLIFYLGTLLLSFISRKVYINYLGTELLGLNTTAQNLLGFLNIAEMGIGSAIACTLYKPLFDKDEKAINEIVSLQGWLYSRIAMIVGGGGVVLMLFFPLIFAKADVPASYTYMSFGVYLFGALLSYFVNYQSIVLSADQKDYKVRIAYNSILLIKVLFQIIAVRYLSHPYIWWCVLELTFAILASFSLTIVIKREAPYLRTTIRDGKSFIKKYTDIITKVKQYFFHKISEFVLVQSVPLILYGFTTLSTVAIFGNYLTISSGLQGLTKSAVSSIGASVGNLLSEGNQKKTMRVFDELFSFRFFVSVVVTMMFYFLASPFVSIWLGDEYIIGRSTVVLMCLSIFISISRSTVDEYLYAKGLFKDIWAPVAEAVINLVFAISLGSFFGLNGVLLGGVVSQLVIVCCWKPYFLFKEGLNEPVWSYVKIYLRLLFPTIMVSLLVFWLRQIVICDLKQGFFIFIIYAFALCFSFSVLLFLAMNVTSQGMRDFTQRTIGLLKNMIRH